MARAREAAPDGDLTALALQTALQNPLIDRVLIGIDRVEQIEEAVKIARRVDPLIPADQIRALDLDGDPATDPRTWPR